MPIFLLLLMFSCLILAQDYNETGNFNSYFRQGTGFFNTGLTSTESITRAISSPKQTPLITDLDNDGINEIIILDGSTFRLFQGKNLAIVDSFNLPTDERVSNFITFDIDDDNLTEIIVVREVSKTMHILEYNGTSFHNQSSYDLSSFDNFAEAEVMIKCGKTENCFMAFTSNIDGVGGARNISIASFNSSTAGSQILLEETTDSNNNYCFPKIKAITYADYDGDNTDEYIFTYSLFRKLSDEQLHIIYVDVADNMTVTKELDITDTTFNPYTVGANDCTNDDINLGKTFTAPLVFDIDGSISNGLETVIAMMVDSDEFKMHSYKSNGDFLDDYPEVFQADGVLISNIIKINAFADSDAVDFCVMGYDDVDGEIDLLCASEQATWSHLFINYETREFIFDTSLFYNITQDYGNWNVITHAAQHSTATFNGANLDEVVNSYGVLSLNLDTSCRIQIPPIKCLDLIFENPKADAVVLSVDAEKTGRDDLIVQTKTNLWYIDDEFANSPATISDYFINPCIDSTWKVNTSAEVRITAIDIDNDLVSARAILYYNDENEQDTGWSSNSTSGTTFSFADFKANKTIGVGTLRLIARDTGVPDVNTSIDITFSVGSNGVEFNDCTTEVDLIAEAAAEADEFDPTATDVQDNSITSGLTVFSKLFGLSELIILLLGMLFIAWSIWSVGHEMANPNQGFIFGTIVLVEIMVIVIGTLLGIIPPGIVITFAILGILVIGMWFRSFFTGTSSA